MPARRDPRCAIASSVARRGSRTNSVTIPRAGDRKPVSRPAASSLPMTVSSSRASRTSRTSNGSTQRPVTASSRRFTHRSTSHSPSSLSFIAENARPVPASSTPLTAGGTRSAERSVAPVMGFRTSSAHCSIASMVAPERGPCNSTANPASKRPTHCASGVSDGHPACPGRSGSVFRDSSPTARTSVTAIEPSSVASYSASPSLNTVHPMESLNSDTYR